MEWSSHSRPSSAIALSSVIKWKSFWVAWAIAECVEAFSYVGKKQRNEKASHPMAFTMAQCAKPCSYAGNSRTIMAEDCILYQHEKVFFRCNYRKLFFPAYDVPIWGPMFWYIFKKSSNAPCIFFHSSVQHSKLVQRRTLKQSWLAWQENCEIWASWGVMCGAKRRERPRKLRPSRRLGKTSKSIVKVMNEKNPRRPIIRFSR